MSSFMYTCMYVSYSTRKETYILPPVSLVNKLPFVFMTSKGNVKGCLFLQYGDWMIIMSRIVTYLTCAIAVVIITINMT